MTIVNVHAPTEVADQTEKEEFHEHLETILDKIPSYDLKIITGDFNVKIGKEERNKDTAGNNSLHDETNDNGQIVIDSAASRKMVVSSTMLVRKNVHKETWISPN